MGEPTRLSLLNDRNFQKIMERASREGLLWNDFLAMPQPLNTSPAETWRALKCIRRYSAFSVPYQEVDDYRIWYSPTAFLSHAAATISDQCQTTAPLSQLLLNNQGNYYRTRFQVNETINCARRDGLVLSQETAFEVLESKITSKKPEMLLLRNIFTTMESLDDYLDKPFSLDLIESLVQRISRGVDFEAIPKTSSEPTGVPESESVQSPFEREQLQALCDYANGETGDPFEHPLFRAIIFRTGVCTYCPQPELAYIISQLCFNLFAFKAHLPLLALLPFTETILEWEENTHTQGNHEAEFASSNLGAIAQGTIDEEERTVDFTPLITVAIGLILQSLRKVEAFVAEREESAQKTLKRLQGDPGLNRRQLTVLESLCRTKGTACTIRQHQISQKIAYATARADLLDLVDRGFLRQEKQSKGFAFLPTSLLTDAMTK